MLLAEIEQPVAEQTFSPLAWAGWQLQMPSDWRPLKLHGTVEKGSMMVGDSVCAMFSIHWERPDKRSVRSGHDWVDKRFEKLGIRPEGTPPASKHFTACGWSRAVQTEEDKLTTYWYGYSESADLVMGIKVNGVLPVEQLELINEQVLPTLRTTVRRGETTWAMHEVSIVSPAGFDFSQRHLYMGDVAMEFRKNRHETIMLRQVYPAELALDRRPIKKWIASYPFKEHRRFRRSSEVTNKWHAPSGKRQTGIRREGRKRLGFPLGFLAPRWTHALAVHDEQMDRLLIAEHMAAHEPDGTLCEQAIAQMNQPIEEGR